MTNKSKILTGIGTVGMLLSTATLCSAIVCENGRAYANAFAYGKALEDGENFEDTVQNNFGRKKRITLRDDIVQNFILQHPPVMVYDTERGTTLCIDLYTGTYFRSDINRVKQAVRELNSFNRFFSLNDLYREWGVPEIKNGDHVGWQKLSDIFYSSHTASNGERVFAIRYFPETI